MSKKILVPLAKGFEEAEFIGIVDILRRAGLEVNVVSLHKELLIEGAHKIYIKADISFDEVDIDSMDAIALAGGLEGMLNLKNDKRIIQSIKKLHGEGKLICAICASPVVLNEAGVLQGNFTCYPGCESGLNGTRIDEAVVVNKNVITGAGPATAILFGLEIAKYLLGEESYKKLYEELLLPLTK